MRSSVLARVCSCVALRCDAMRLVTSSHANAMHRYVFSHPSFVLVVARRRRRRRASSCVDPRARAHKDTRRHTPRAISCPTDRFIHSLQQGFHACDNRGHLSSGLEGSTMYILGWHHHYHHHRTFDTPSFFRTVPRARVDWRVPRRRRGRWLVRVRWVGVLARARAWGARVDA